MENVYLHNSQLYKKLRDFVNQSLSNKQKILLWEVFDNNEEFNGTQLVDCVTKKHNLPETTVWYNLKKLKSLGLIDFGDFSSRGEAVVLTEFGKIVCGGDRNG